MKIFVLNCGSSSIKYQLIDSEAKKVIANGLLEKIGNEERVLKHYSVYDYTDGQRSYDGRADIPVL